MTADFIEVFADIVCPFTHVGLRRFVAQRAQLGWDRPALHVRAWPLELVNGQPFDPDVIARYVVELRRQIVPDLFQGFTPAAVPESSLAAFALVAQAYAVTERLGETVALAVRTALFEDGRNLGNPDVIADLARTHGIEVPGRDAAAAVDADYAEGRRRNVAGSPEFFLGERRYFCPALQIDRTDNRVVIQLDTERFEAFLADCFRR